MLNGSFAQPRYLESAFGTQYAVTRQDGLILPRGIRQYKAAGRSWRPAAAAVLGWKPTSGTSMLLTFDWGQQVQHSVQSAIDYNVGALDVALPLRNVVLAPNGQFVRSASFDLPATTGDLPTGSDQTVAYRQTGRQRNITWDGSIETDSALVTGQLTWGKSRGATSAYSVIAGLPPLAIDARFDDSAGGDPAFDVSGPLRDGSRFPVGAIARTFDATNGAIFAARGDVKILTPDIGWIRNVRAGMRYTRRTGDSRSGSLAAFAGYQLSLADLPGGRADYALTGGYAGVRGSFPRAWAAYPAGQLFTAAGVDALRRFAADTLGTPEFALDDARIASGNYYDAGERTMAAYAQLTYDLDIGIPVDGVVGARLINTATTIAAPDLDQGGLFVSGSGRGNYNAVNPAAIAVLHFTSKLQGRLAATRTMIRPDFRQLVPTPQIAFGDGSAPPPVTVGNPALRAPRVSNYDAALEYYFGRAGSLTLSVFRRNTRDVINQVTTPFATVPGIPFPVNLVQTLNSGKGSFEGLEAGFSTTLDVGPRWLRNFGGSGNFSTYSSRELVGTRSVMAAGIARYTYNASVFYDDGTMSARLSLNDRTRYVANYSLDPAEDRYVSPPPRLDFSASYNVTRHLQVLLDATNLLNGASVTWYGADRQLYKTRYRYGRSASVSVRTSF